MWNRFGVLIFFIYLCFVFGDPAGAAYRSLSEEARRCLECHAKPGLEKKFENSGSVIAYVDPEAFVFSVHGAFQCSDCHSDFTGQNHPSRRFRNKEQYRIKASLACRQCHTDEIRTTPVHEPLFTRENTGEAMICTNCHSAHAVDMVSAGHATTSEEKYCMRCHSQETKKIFRNGESIALTVDINEIRTSSHRNVACSECHFGYSAEEHPRKRFRSEREYRLSSTEMCRRCHFDKYSKISESIHYSLINVGRLDAPTCIDCHGGHAVLSPGEDRLSVVNKCRNCHRDIYNIYSKSVHGNALINRANKDVPLCIDCHSSHSIKDPLMAEFHNYIPDMCSECHSDEVVMSKYGLSTEVVNTYLSDFHGLTLSLYQEEAQERDWSDKPMAVCTDCHGTHDIMSMAGADLELIKKNLLTRCQTCHNDATENFPKAWLSHHKPSLKYSAGVFLVEKFYKIILPLMVVGLLFQVLLQIWSYLMKR